MPDKYIPSSSENALKSELDRLEDPSVRQIVEAGIRRLRLIAHDATLPPRENETKRDQEVRLRAERAVVLGMLGSLGIVPHLDYERQASAEDYPNYETTPNR